jgi:hypothetical protein
MILENYNPARAELAFYVDLNKKGKASQDTAFDI